VVRRRNVYPHAARLPVSGRDHCRATRKVLAWRLSNNMDAGFCVAALEEALARFGKPEIFNTDQGSQFTSFAFTSVLREAEIRINMDGWAGGRTMSSSSASGALWNTSASTSTPSRPARS